MAHTNTRCLTESEKLLATCGTLSKRFNKYPGLCNLVHYNSEWTEWNDDFTLPELNEEIMECLNDFLNQATENQIKNFFHRLRTEEKLQPAKIHIRNMIPEIYDRYQPPKLKGVPRQFTTPLFPFPSVNRNSGAVLQLSKPLYNRKNDKTALTVKNVALFPRDMKTLVALTEILKNKPIENFGNAFVSFKTSRVEILEEMGCTNPRTKDVREGVWHSLERMRACTITWTDKKGRQNIGGILSKARELEEDSAFEIEIFLDVDFLKMYEGGFANLDKEALYRMSDREIVMYMFFDGKLNYKQTGKFKMNLLELYDQITIEMEGTNRSERKVRYQMKELLWKCEELGIIGKHKYDGDVLKIEKLGNLFNTPKN